jgi:putative ABC transport system substrate-binding protein
MQRREFITFVSCVVAGWPVVVRAQQNIGPRKVGVLFPGVISEGLFGELGGEKAALVVRSAGGDGQLLAKYAAEFVSSVEVILAIASDSLVAARQASQTIPIVALDLESDPIASGVAQSLTDPAAA